MLSVDPREWVDAVLESALSKPVSPINQERIPVLGSLGGFSETLC